MYISRNTILNRLDSQEIVYIVEMVPMDLMSMHMADFSYYSEVFKSTVDHLQKRNYHVLEKLFIDQERKIDLTSLKPSLEHGISPDPRSTGFWVTNIISGTSFCNLRGNSYQSHS